MRVCAAVRACVRCPTAVRHEKTAVRTQNNASFEEGFVNYKRLFKMVGILSIVTIGLYIFVLIGFLLFEGFSSFPIN